MKVIALALFLILGGCEAPSPYSGTTYLHDYPRAGWESPDAYSNPRVFHAYISHLGREGMTVEEERGD